MQDWKSYEGWSQLTKQPGEEGARHSVILSLLVDHSLFVHPDQQHQLKNNLPAYTVGSLRAHVQVECLVEVIDDLVSSDNPQDKRKRFTKALSNSKFGSQDVSSLGLRLRASLDSSLSPLIMKSIR